MRPCEVKTPRIAVQGAFGEYRVSSGQVGRIAVCPILR